MLVPFKNINTYKFNVPNDESKHSYDSLIYTLESVAYLFSRYFPTLGEKPLIVLINDSISNPIAYRTSGMILLHTRPERWSQAAYQFAHELCHYMIPDDSPERLKWLEESICETASYYFLRKLTKYWKRIEAPFYDCNNNPYADLFTDYVIDDSKKAESFNLFDESEIINLENDRYQRKKNSHIANLLLPIFQKHYKTWEAIPYLCSIPDSLPLKDALREWIQISPQESYNGLIQIYSLFFEEEFPL